MKHVLCIRLSEIIRETSRCRGRGRVQVDEDLAEFFSDWEETIRGREHWAAHCCGESIDESEWHELADWIGQESPRSTLHALSDLLDADLPLHPSTEELIEVREALTRLEVEALNEKARAASDKLAGFLDMAIKHAKECEGNPRRISSAHFQWHD
jgi:hypothetical protein